MRYRVPALAVAFVAAWLAAAPGARADVIRLRDGKWHGLRPEDAKLLNPGEPPWERMIRESDIQIVELNFDAVSFLKKGSQSPQSEAAHRIDDIWPTFAVVNDAYRRGIAAGVNHAYDVAAQAFREAFEQAGADRIGRHYSLLMLLESHAAAGDADAAEAAANELIAAFPKSLHLPRARKVQARIAAARRDHARAIELMETLKGEVGAASPREYWDAEYHRIWLGLETAGKQGEAERAYRDAAAQIERLPRPNPAEDVRHKCLVGVGNTLLARWAGTGKKDDALVAEAEKAYLEAAGAAADATVLAMAYNGLGDILFHRASVRRAALAERATPEQRKQVLDLYEKSLLYYLRVALLYGPNSADDGPVINAHDNAGRCFETLYRLTPESERNVETLRRAAAHFFQAANALTRDSPKRRELAAKMKELQAEIDAGAPAEGGGGK